VPLGIIPAYGGAVRLARYVGRGKAMEMVLLGERITAAEAYRVGLVNKVVPLSELLPLASDYARRLATLPPLAVRMAKESLNKDLTLLRSKTRRKSISIVLCCSAKLKTVARHTRRGGKNGNRPFAGDNQLEFVRVGALSGSVAKWIETLCYIQLVGVFRRKNFSI
jgi:Enoyl-CoA hydratase/isomerase